MLRGLTDQDLTRLGLRMVGVGVNLRQGVLEYGRGFLERHAVRT